MSPVDTSVVVPVFRDFQDLEKCLEALNAQTVRERLQIVVSLDGEHTLPDGLAKMTDLVVEGPHAGPAAARNRGWRASGGSLVLFTDSDCIPRNDWAEEMTVPLKADADAVKGVYTGGGDACIQRLAQIEFLERYSLLSKAEKIDMIDTYSAGYRREVLESTGGFDESFPFPDHEDVDLSYRMAKAGCRLRFVPSAGVRHTHRDTWWGYSRMKFSRGRWRVRVLRRFPEMIGGGSYTPLSLKVQIGLCALLPLVIALIPFQPLLSAAWAAAYILAALPLFFIALRTDPAVAIMVPAFCLARGCALTAGLMRGLMVKERDEG
ncbi:MAG: glycosyltransferase [Candidatus Aegiribacteria sp.]|nr:glycosyltransferase [Candidatus Aegiribacteria sp.]